MKSFGTLARASTVATFLLISIGGLVRATKSGLGCGDDWPHCSGEVLPPLQDPNQIIEFSHRAAAGIVGFMILALAVLAYRHYRDNARVLWSSVGALALVIFQALLGMVVVKTDLHALMVVVHLSAALSLLALLIYIVGAVREPEDVRSGDATISKRARLAAGSVFVLLLVGSYVSGADAGYAFPDWPLMDGKVIPNLAVEQKAIHFFHRGLAAVVGVIVYVVAIDILKRGADFPAARRFTHIAAGLFAVEIVIGALNVWTRLNSAAVTAHLAIGAAIWGSLVAVAVVASPAKAAVRRAAIGESATVAEVGS